MFKLIFFDTISLSKTKNSHKLKEKYNQPWFKKLSCINFNNWGDGFLIIRMFQFRTSPFFSMFKHG